MKAHEILYRYSSLEHGHCHSLDVIIMTIIDVYSAVLSHQKMGCFVESNASSVQACLCKLKEIPSR